MAIKLRAWGAMMIKLKCVMYLLFLSLIGCAGGETPSHAEISKEFITQLNFHTVYDSALVKTDALVEDYIVVFDRETSSYDAYYLQGYRPGNNAALHLELFAEKNSYDLAPLGNNTYRDQTTGVVFSKVAMTSSDLTKAQEIIDELKLKKATEQLTIEYGLPPRRAKKIAALALQLKNINPENATVYSYNQYSKALIGTSIDEIQEALDAKSQGDNTAIERVFERASRLNGISVNRLKRLVDEFSPITIRQ